MAFNFPSAPVPGQVYGKYSWDGEKWITTSGGGGGGGGLERDYGTVANVVAANIPASVLNIRTAGYYAVGDGGHARYKRVGSGPTSRSRLQSSDGAFWDFMGNEVNILAMGSKTDGTDSLAAVNAAKDVVAALGGGKIIFPPGITDISARVLFNSPNVTLVGDVGTEKCQVRVPRGFNGGVIAFDTTRGVTVTDLTIDQNVDPAASGPTRNAYSSSLLVSNCGLVRIERCAVNGVGNLGIVIESCTDFVVKGNKVTFPAPTGTFNNASIGIYSSISASSNGKILDNVCNGSGIFGGGNAIEVSGNFVLGIKYGGAINTTTSNYWVITNNTLANGRSGVGDFNNTATAGMEILGYNHIIADNNIFDFDGAGIVMFGDDSVIHDNTIWDVCKLTSGPVQNRAAISMADTGGGLGQSGSRNFIHHNKVFQTGGRTDILYGYEEFNSGAGIVSNRVADNQLVGATAKTRITAPTTLYFDRTGWQTFTLTPIAASGTPTFTINSARYMVEDKKVTVCFDFTVASVGGATGLIFLNMPVPSNGNRFMVNAQDNDGTNKMVKGLSTTPNQFTLQTFDNQPLFVVGARPIGTLVYEMA